MTWHLKGEAKGSDITWGPQAARSLYATPLLLAPTMLASVGQLA